MEETHVRRLQFLALQVVGAVAIIHLVVGGQKLLRIATQGLLGVYLTQYLWLDPRPALFVVSALALLVGVVATARGWIDRRLAYRLGLVVLVGYVLGWVGWHSVLDHGRSLGGSAATARTHGHDGLGEVLWSHYVVPVVDAVTASASGTPGTGRVLLGVISVTLELVGTGLLLVLLRVDPRAEREAEPNPFRRAERAETRESPEPETE